MERDGSRNAYAHSIKLALDRRVPMCHVDMAICPMSQELIYSVCPLSSVRNGHVPCRCLLRTSVTCHKAPCPLSILNIRVIFQHELKFLISLVADKNKNHYLEDYVILCI